MRRSPKTDPVDCGPGCMALTGDGVDLVEKHFVAWIDEEAEQVGVYAANGEPALQSNGKPKFDIDLSDPEMPVKVIVLDVPQLRFISARQFIRLARANGEGPG